MEKGKKKQICIWATEQEIRSIERIRNFYDRNSVSDTLRFLINQECKKILG